MEPGARNVYWACLVIGLVTILLLSALFVDWLSETDQPTVRTVTTVTSMADAFRRLELRGYSHVKETNAMGQNIVGYERRTPSAVFLAEIIKWSGDQRIRQLCFSCRTKEEAFNSKESRRKLWGELGRDVCAMVNAKQDYLRAWADMKEIDDSGLPRYEGRATTSEGWELQVIEYVGYYKPQVHGEPDDLAMAAIIVTHLETAEQMPASAILAYDRQLQNAKDKYSNETGQEDSSSDLIEFDGRVWRKTGPLQPPTLDYFLFQGDVYTCNDSALRLLDLVPVPGSGRDGFFERILVVQKRGYNGAWKNHGLEETWLLGGPTRHETARYQMGKMHGERLGWDENGQLVLREQWREGLEHGLHESWYSNGQKEYEIEYSFGQEVSGKLWDINGNPE